MGWLWLILFVAKVSRAPRDQPIPSARFQSIRIGVQFQLVDTLNLILMTTSKSIISLLGLFFDNFSVQQLFKLLKMSCVYFWFQILISSESKMSKSTFNDYAPVRAMSSWEMCHLGDAPIRGKILILSSYFNN